MLIESKAEQKYNRGGSDASKEMKKPTHAKAKQKSGLDIGHAVKPAEKALNRLAKEKNESLKTEIPTPSR